MNSLSLSLAYPIFALTATKSRSLNAAGPRPTSRSTWPTRFPGAILESRCSSKPRQEGKWLFPMKMCQDILRIWCRYHLSPLHRPTEASPWLMASWSNVKAVVGPPIAESISSCQYQDPRTKDFACFASNKHEHIT